VRANTDFLSSGYAKKVLDGIFNGYSAKTFINPYDVQVLRKFSHEFVYLKFLNSNTIELSGPPITITFETKLIEDPNINIGTLRFEERYSDFNLLFVRNILPSKRINFLALLTEKGQYISI
jgi:hypothetical protein